MWPETPIPKREHYFQYHCLAYQKTAKEVFHWVSGLRNRQTAAY